MPRRSVLAGVLPALSWSGSRARRAAPAPGATQGVTTIELFFDLVFVYSITQVTTLVRDSHGARGYLQAAAVLIVTWWMYDGYAWLTNNVGPVTVATRVPYLVGMAGFLIMAIATPAAFDGSAWAFAIAYLVVVLLHGAQFATSSLGSSSTAIRGVLPLNVAAALALMLAAALGHDLAWIGWLLAVLIIGVVVVVRRERGFALRVGHFAERHQLIVIIALGETVVAVGGGAEGRLDEALVVTAVLLSLALLSAVWWLYFGGDDERAAAAMAQVPETEAASVALRAYSMAHLLHVAGLVLVAAGLHEVVATPAAGLSARFAVTTGAGIAVFLLGELTFTGVLRLPGRGRMVIGAVLALLVSPLGLANGLAELAALLLVTVAVVMAGAEGPATDSRLDLA